jgi:site-specific recombinase XerD
MLRYIYATHHVRKGTGLKTVQQALSHANLKTIEIRVHLAWEVIEKELQRHAL